MKRSSAKQMRAPVGRPVRVEWDDYESRGYLDTTEFAEYCLKVKDVVYKGAEWVAEQKRMLGKDFDPDRHQDALDSLRGIGEIALVNEIIPKRYVPSILRVIEKPSYNQTLVLRKNDKVWPFDDFAERPRRLTGGKPE